MLVASHTAVPIGTAKWLEEKYRKRRTLPLGKGRIKFIAYLQAGDMPFGVPYLWQGIPFAASSPPAISNHLTAILHGWLLTSNAYGISLNRDKLIEINYQLLIMNCKS